MSAVPKEKYRLQPVLDVRGKAKQAAACLVATRREQLAAAEAELARRRQELAACSRRQVAAQEKMLEEFERGVEAHTLVTHRTHLADLRRNAQELAPLRCRGGSGSRKGPDRLDRSFKRGAGH